MCNKGIAAVVLMECRGPYEELAAGLRLCMLMAALAHVQTRSTFWEKPEHVFDQVWARGEMDKPECQGLEL